MSPAKERRVALRDTTMPAWGKSDRDRSEYHHLAHHSMDVAAVFMALLNSPVIEERAERAAAQQIGSTARARLGALVFLHDIGKLHPGFQAKGWSKDFGRHAKGFPAGAGLVRGHSRPRRPRSFPRETQGPH